MRGGSGRASLSGLSITGSGVAGGKVTGLASWAPKPSRFGAGSSPESALREKPAGMSAESPPGAGGSPSESSGLGRGPRGSDTEHPMALPHPATFPAQLSHRKHQDTRCCSWELENETQRFRFPEVGGPRDESETPAQRGVLQRPKPTPRPRHDIGLTRASPPPHVGSKTDTPRGRRGLFGTESTLNLGWTLFTHVRGPRLSPRR